MTKGYSNKKTLKNGQFFSTYIQSAKKYIDYILMCISEVQTRSKQKTNYPMAIVRQSGQKMAYFRAKL